MPLSRIKPQMESSQLRLDSSAASTDVNDRVLLNGVDSSSTGDGYAVILEDATANAFDGGVFTFSQAPISIANPAFRARMSADQTGISTGTYTKLEFDYVQFDTTGDYDGSTNYRFTPSVSGYYQINLMAGDRVKGYTQIYTAIYKNGSIYSFSGNYVSSGHIRYTRIQTSALVDLNGTDYVEGFFYFTLASGTGTIDGDLGDGAYFDGVLVSRTA